MIEVESAIKLIERYFVKVEKERVSLNHLVGRTLATPIKAKRDQPPFDRVAMDGIAVSFHGCSSRGYKIEGVQKAGQPQKELKQQHNAIEVMTGSMLPLGTDTVIPYENLLIEGGIATLKEEYELEERKNITTRPPVTASPLDERRGADEERLEAYFPYVGGKRRGRQQSLSPRGEPLRKNIHFLGSDYSSGKTLLKAGTKLTSAAVALIAGQGDNGAIVSKLPKVAIISTGDELVEPGKQCLDWQIWRSNTYGIYSELAGLGYSSSNVDFFHLDDNKDEMLALLSKVLKTHRILILSGGISMGKYDYVHTIMNDLYVTRIFHKIKQKPGKPMYFGIGEEGQNVFGLPGNPVSALVCMRRYIIPGLEQALGGVVKKYSAVLNQDVHFKKDFSLFKAVYMECSDNGQLLATPIPSNGSGDFLGLGKSDGFLELPANKEFYKTGEVFPYFPWAEV